MTIDIPEYNYEKKETNDQTFEIPNTKSSIIEKLINDKENWLISLSKIPTNFIESILISHYKWTNPEEILNILKEIVKLRENFWETNLFSQRNVVAFWDEHDGFLPSDLLHKSLDKAVKSFQIINLPENKLWVKYNDIKEMESNYIEKIRDKIINTPPPFTILFQWHWAWWSFLKNNEPWYLRVSDGKYNFNIQIKLLAEFWKERIKNFPIFDDKNDIIILDNCYSQPIAKDFSKFFWDENWHPIILWSSRDNVWFWDMKNNPYKTELMKTILEKENVTIKDYMDNITYEFEKSSLNKSTHSPRVNDILKKLYTPPYLHLPNSWNSKWYMQTAENNYDNILEWLNYA